MRASDLVRLVTLAALWGAAYLFVRMAVSSLGTAWLTELRVLIAALAMLIYARVISLDLDVRRNLHAYVAMGILNTALPWAMFAYAGNYISAGYMAITNAATPAFGALCGVLWLGEKLTWRKVLGLVLGLAGVALIVGLGPIEVTAQVVISAVLCVLASACYALGPTYIKKRAPGVPALSMSVGSLVVATVVVIPFLPAPPPLAAFSWQVMVAVLGISLLCSAAAYLLYFRLITNVGPTKTLSVTFLTPIFGVFWGIVFLNEALRPMMVVGGAMVLTGTALVLDMMPRRRPAAARG